LHVVYDWHWLESVSLGQGKDIGPLKQYLEPVSEDRPRCLLLEKSLCSYNGEWMDGVPHGEGKATWPDGG
jgi:hypothetical protein